MRKFKYKKSVKLNNCSGKNDISYNKENEVMNILQNILDFSLGVNINDQIQEGKTINEIGK
jgi:hypothetical protein